MRSIIFFVCIGLLSGCSRRAPTPREQEEAAAKQRKIIRERVAEPIYDPRGRLIESDTNIVGLKLPRGLELKFKTAREHTYYSSIDLALLETYFAKQLLTSRVEKVGMGLMFRNARVRNAPESNPLLDVSILPLSAGGIRSRVSIIELPPASPNPPKEEDVIKYVRERMKRLD